MSTLLQVFSILSLQLLGLASPGPAFLLSAKHGMSHPRRVHLATAAGLGSGSTFYTILGFLGVTAFIAQSPLVFNSIKYLGAIYLIYIGLRSIMTRQEKPEYAQIKQKMSGPSAELSPLTAFRMGAGLNLSNPKTALYYLALFSSVISPDTPLLAKSLILILTPPLAWGWYAFVATSFSLPWFQTFYGRFKQLIDYLFGGVMIVLGLMVAFS